MTTADNVDRLRLEIKSDLKEINDKVTDLQVKQAVDTTRLGTIIAGITIVTAAVVSVIMNTIIK